jgi:sulfite exporter TauE/SafE
MTYLEMLTLMNIGRTLGYALLGLHGLATQGTL